MRAARRAARRACRGNPLNWWDATWNVVAGCDPASTGCKFCYAARLAATTQTAHRIALYEETTEWVRGRAVFNGNLTALDPRHADWTWPLKWPGAEQPLLGTGKPSLIFVGDMTDIFHEKRSPEIIDRVVSVIAASRHIGLLCTKRSDQMAAYFTAERLSPKTVARWQKRLWLGFSSERQTEFDQRWMHMRKLADAGWVVFVSLAPLLAPIVLPPDFLSFGGQCWAICSAEQGAEARPMDFDWARAIRDQCAAERVPFFMLSKKVLPPDLLIWQFPRCDGGTP
jgi:protein gp37